MKVATSGSLLALAERQWGLVSVDQALDLGVTSSAWAQQLARGEWERLSHRVVRRRGAPRGPKQRALAGVLDACPSAYLSHGSAAALWGVTGFRLEPVEVMVVRDRRRWTSTLAVVHRPRHLPDRFGTVLDGIPVARPALVLLQLAPQVSAVRLQVLLDRMWSRRLLSGPSLRRELAPLMHRGRPGVAKLRRILEALPADYVPAASGLELRFAQILADAGLAEMRRQVDVGGEAWSGRVDFLARDVPLVVEVDSERYHSALSDQRADAARHRRLEADGFVVVRVTDTEVWHRPARVVEVVRKGRHQARHRGAA